MPPPRPRWCSSTPSRSRRRLRLHSVPPKHPELGSCGGGDGTRTHDPLLAKGDLTSSPGFVQGRTAPLPGRTCPRRTEAYTGDCTRSDTSLIHRPPPIRRLGLNSELGRSHVWAEVEGALP